jgi:hypothetical protein
MQSHWFCEDAQPTQLSVNTNDISSFLNDMEMSTSISSCIFQCPACNRGYRRLANHHLLLGDNNKFISQALTRFDKRRYTVQITRLFSNIHQVASSGQMQQNSHATVVSEFIMFDELLHRPSLLIEMHAAFGLLYRRLISRVQDGQVILPVLQFNRLPCCWPFLMTHRDPVIREYASNGSDFRLFNN